MSPGPAVARVEPDTAVIQGKLGIPAPAKELVDRPRLDLLLADLIDHHRTVVVSATAGSGKTTAVATALRHGDRPVAWLTVDATDCAPGRLLTYLEAALADPLPYVSGTVAEAMAASIPHAEVAGLLAEAVGDESAVLVLDELERLADGSDAWAVIEALLRHAPAELHEVLISRREVPAVLWARGPWKSEVAMLRDADLAFTTAEAAAALSLHDPGVDPETAVEATGGWVTGVLFEAWRARGHVAGSGGEADPLHGYLSTHILSQLDPVERDFLVATSLLDEVTPDRGAALGQSEAAQCLRRLRRAHLPVTWAPKGLVMRCHSRFREYLLERLEEKDPDERRTLRLAYAGLLCSEGHDEEATEEFLVAGALPEALECASRAIVPIIERLDFPVAERWLKALEPVADQDSGKLAMAEVMIALARNDLGRGNAIADRLAAAGRRDELVRQSATMAGLLGWCYLHAGRFEEAQGLLDLMEPSLARDALSYGISLWEPGPPVPRPDLSGGPLDGLILIADYHYGRWSEIIGEGAAGWMDVMAHPARIGALRAVGRTQEALELYEAARAHGVGTQRLEVSYGVEVLVDAGLLEEAAEALARRRAHAAKSGSLAYQIQVPELEAKLALRGHHDPGAALAALDELERRPYARDFPFLTEHLDTWYGLALLMRSEDEAALERLRPTVHSMLEGDRLLELPTAAVYLSEAEWRAGNDDAADACADLALDTARRLGSNHVLLQALHDFPGVVSRRIDAEPGADSPWHELGRALIARGAEVEARPQALVSLLEFGRCAILVGGEEVRPRIRKTYELLAYLSTRRGASATRSELLHALFDGRDDDSTRAYLRQAVRWLRQALPDEAGIESEGGEVRLTGGVRVTSESTKFEAKLAAAAGMRDETRLSAILDALAIYDQGEYLPGARTSWVDGRMHQLAQLAGDARYEAAELACTVHRYDQATQLADQVLEVEPYRETAWRLKMRIAAALGDDDGVIRAYHGCEQALAAVGAGPSPTTRDLLERLRR
jgi:DNA-binding SARP family transcriptional activator